MKTTDFTINEKKISYNVEEDKGGYTIYLGDTPWITQYPPYIPFQELSLEEGCLKQIQEIIDGFNSVEEESVNDVEE